VLAFAMLCPVTAAYTGIAMTECLSVFAVSLGVYAMGRALAAARTGCRGVSAIVLAACAAALAMMLRPDGAVLFAALAAGLFWYTAGSRTTNSTRPNNGNKLASCLMSTTAGTVSPPTSMIVLQPWPLSASTLRRSAITFRFLCFGWWIWCFAPGPKPSTGCLLVALE
jgi:hypothetical protein